MVYLPSLLLAVLFPLLNPYILTSSHQEYLYSSLLLFIFLEVMLFLAYFWWYFHNISYSGPASTSSSPSTITPLIVLSGQYYLLAGLILSLLSTYLSLSSIIIFIVLSFTEYNSVLDCVYINDNAFVTIQLTIVALHLLHLLVGMLFILSEVAYPHYYHFIEVIWLLIGYCIYFSHNIICQDNRYSLINNSTSNTSPSIALTAMSHLRFYTVSLNLNYFYNFGFLLGVSIFIQTVSGIFLTLIYYSSLELYSNIYSLTFDYYYGYLYRYIHIVFASVINTLLLVHMYKALLYSNFNTQIYTHYSGFILYILIVVISYLGYILTYGQLSYWGATVIINLLPVQLATLILGSYAISSITISRYLIFHMLLSFILYFFIVLHIFYLHSMSSQSPVPVSIRKGTALQPSITFLFFIYKDLTSTLALLSGSISIALFTMLTLSHPINMIPINSLVTPAHIVPEWYFLFLYSILKIIPNKLGGILGVVLAFLLIILFTTTSHSTHISSSTLIPSSHNSDLINSILAAYIYLSYIGVQLPIAPYIVSCRLCCYILFTVLILFSIEGTQGLHIITRVLTLIDRYYDHPVLSFLYNLSTYLCIKGTGDNTGDTDNTAATHSTDTDTGTGSTDNTKADKAARRKANKENKAAEIEELLKLSKKTKKHLTKKAKKALKVHAKAQHRIRKKAQQLKLKEKAAQLKEAKKAQELKMKEKKKLDAAQRKEAKLLLSSKMDSVKTCLSTAKETSIALSALSKPLKNLKTALSANTITPRELQKLMTKIKSIESHCDALLFLISTLPVSAPSSDNTTTSTVTHDATEASDTQYINIISSTNHKRIGLYYLLTSSYIAIMGIVLSIIMRIELSSPSSVVIHSANVSFYNYSLSNHGLLMLLFIVMPIVFGAFGNYLLVLTLGLIDIVFPRINNLGYLILLLSYIIIQYSILTEYITGAGWTLYPPLSTITSTYIISSMYIALTISGVSSLLTSINYLLLLPYLLSITDLLLVSFTITSIMVLYSIPVLAGAFLLATSDILLTTSYFSNYSDPVLYQHLFWFFGHPEVYILILPSFGLINYQLSQLTANYIFGTVSMILALISILLFGTIVWSHHMFTVNLESDTNLYFTVLTLIIAIPTGTKLYNWLYLANSSSYMVNSNNITNLVLAYIFLIIVIQGGVTGVVLGNNILDLQLHDTYYVVSHFHYILSVATVISIVLTVYTLAPNFNELRIVPTLTSVLTPYLILTVSILLNTIFLPMYFLGFNTMPRRIPEYADYLYLWNNVSSTSVIAFYLAIAILLLL
jgi:cytochrome c oxidase subunit 1